METIRPTLRPTPDVHNAAVESQIREKREKEREGGERERERERGQTILEAHLSTRLAFFPSLKHICQQLGWAEAELCHEIVAGFKIHLSLFFTKYKFLLFILSYCMILILPISYLYYWCPAKSKFTRVYFQDRSQISNTNGTNITYLELSGWAVKQAGRQISQNYHCTELLLRVEGLWKSNKQN